MGRPAATGFAMLFNVRVQALPIVAAIAVLAKLISLVAVNRGLTLIVADFAAAFIVGPSPTLGPRLGEASPVFAFAPVIPLCRGDHRQVVHPVPSRRGSPAPPRTTPSTATSSSRRSAHYHLGGGHPARALPRHQPHAAAPAVRTAED